MLIRVPAEPQTRSQVFELVGVFRANIVDVTTDSVTAEVSGPPDKLAAFEDLVRSYGIIELVKTGRIALGRGERGIKGRQLRAAVQERVDQRGIRHGNHVLRAGRRPQR